MKTNKFYYLLLILTLGMFAFSSCEDEFTEEDFLRLQAELSQQNAIEQLMLEAELARSNDSARQALQQAILDYQKEGNAEALRQAGLLLSYTVRVENDGNPVSGATISVSNSATGGRTLAAVSDASGNATLTEVPVGENVIMFSADGYYSVRGVVDFDPIAYGVDYIQVGSVIYPLGRSESSTLEVFASGAAGSTATVTGTVTIETDVTNSTPEIPAGLTVEAILDNSEDIGNSGVYIEDITFVSDNIGTAPVDPATGVYTLTLPARQSGIDYDLVFRRIETTQRIAISSRNGEDLATFEYANVATSFGPAASGVVTSGALTVRGAKIEFPAPPAAGQGLKATAPTTRPKSFNPGSVTFDESNEVLAADNIAFRMNNAGAVTRVPTVTVSGGGATTSAEATATIRGYLAAANITNGGADFGADTDVIINFTQRDADDNIVGPNPLFTLTVTANANGVLPTGAINVAGANPTGDGYDKDNPFTFDSDIVSLVGEAQGAGTGAVISVTYTGYLLSLNFETAGENLTSIPTIAFANGGTGATLPNVTIPAMGFTYEFALDNSENTVEYAILPADVEVLRGASYEPNEGIQTSTTDVVTRVFNGGQTGITFLGDLAVSGGSVVPKAPGTTYRIFSWGVPSLVVTPSTSVRASALAIIGEEGDDDEGQLTNLDDVEVGSGYAGIFGATVVVPAGAPGAGAVITLTGFTTTASGEFEWDGSFVITNPGANYLPNLNPAFDDGNVPFSGSTNITVRTGDNITNNVKYGTGERKEEVGGDPVLVLALD